MVKGVNPLSFCEATSVFQEDQCGYNGSGISGTAEFLSKRLEFKGCAHIILKL